MLRVIFWPLILLLRFKPAADISVGVLDLRLARLGWLDSEVSDRGGDMSPQVWRFSTGSSLTKTGGPSGDSDTLSSSSLSFDRKWFQIASLCSVSIFSQVCSISCLNGWL